MLTRRRPVACLLSAFISALALVLCLFATVPAAVSEENERPNILWITIEDWSTDLSCYGTPGIETPHVDKLASEGVRYLNAFTTSPVCSTSRSAMMTGFHQNYIGANQHRTNVKHPLPDGIRPIPHLFADAGYFTALMSYKVDCNFLPDKREQLFEGKDWKQRKPGQPFFARITFPDTHRKWNRDPQRPIATKDVVLPPYYPDTEFFRRDWANGLEQMQIVDRQVGKILKRLDDEGLADNTIVFFIGDHGRCHIRGKQFLYDGGIRIPMIMRWPGKVTAGEVRDDLVQSIDICATILEAAGIKPPVPIHGQSLFSEEVKNREYIFAARDKMDETHDSMRAIRSKQFKLIHNLMPERPWCQFNRYKEASYPMLAAMNVMHMKGELTPQQAAFMAPRKPEFELFDLRSDPHEVKNLADDPQFAAVKEKMLQELKNWRENVIRDPGPVTEFVAHDAFPESLREGMKVDDWVKANYDDYNFYQSGWPAWYPTRSLSQWEAAVEKWKPYVFRQPDETIKRPSLCHKHRSFADKQKASQKQN